jgi:hypothetical protein
LIPCFTLRLPEHINTLAACPRDETFVANGIQDDGYRSNQNIKDFFRLKMAQADYEFVVSWMA